MIKYLFADEDFKWIYYRFEDYHEPIWVQLNNIYNSNEQDTISWEDYCNMILIKYDAIIFWETYNNKTPRIEFFSEEGYLLFLLEWHDTD